MIILISKFALPVTLLAGLYLLISGNLFSINPFLVVQGLAVIMMAWARRSFQPGQFNIHAEPKEGHLISSGPYKFIRHPMYASALMIIWSGILGHFSPENFAIGFIVTVVVSIRIITEEKYLSTYFPAYLNYSRKTKLIIPFFL
jgi:protein-S-isoprenylcysteine O-methyltransferase Ste14